MSKGVKIALISVLSIISIFAAVVMAFLIKNNLGKVEMNLIDSYEAKFDSVDKIDIDVGSADIEIKESSNDKILVEYYNSEDSDVKIEYKDKKIIFNDTKRKDFHFFKIVRKKVVIYVPKDYNGEFELDLGSGDIKAEVDLSSNVVKIKTGSGDVNLEKNGKIDITTGSGDIRIDEVNQKANISVSSGDININRLKIKENSEITATSGDINISNNECNCYVETEVTSGDVKVNKSDRKSDITMKIKTTSGDIKVN